MIGPGTLVTLAGGWLAGHGVLGALRPTRYRGPLERHATAVLVGFALVSALYLSWVIAFGPLTPTGGRVLLGVAAAPGLAFFWRRSPGEPPELPAEPRSLAKLPCLALLVLACVWCAFYPTAMPMHVFDAIYHFSYKAKVLYHEGYGGAWSEPMSTAWTELDTTIGRIMTHPDYAPGVAGLNALVGLVNGAFDEDQFKALCSLFALVPAAWLWCALRPRGWMPAFTGAFLWVSLPLLYYTKLPNNGDWLGSAYAFLFGLKPAIERFPEVTTGWGMADGQTLDGGADLPLAAYFFGAFVLLWRCLPSSRLPSDRADVGLAGVLLCGALLAKNEGLALTAVLGLAFVLALVVARLAGPRARAEGGPRPAVALVGALAVGLALSSAWFAVRGAIPSIDEDYPSRMTPANWLANADRAGYVLVDGFLHTFLHVLRWNLVWVLFFATLAWSLARPLRFLRHPSLAPVLVFLGACSLYALILLVTPWELPTLFGTVIPGRLVLHVTPVAILATVALLWRSDAEVSDAPEPEPRPPVDPAGRAV